MKKPIHILIAEDVASDADLAKRAILKELKDCEFQVVETHEDFLSALEIFQPDIILADDCLPNFGGMGVLKLAGKHAPLTPVIIWSHSVSEDSVVEYVKAGASNYVLKKKSKRLAAAMLQALEEPQVQLERKQNGNVLPCEGFIMDITTRKQAEDLLRQSENKARALLNALPDLMFRMDRNGTILDYKAERSDLYAQSEPTLIGQQLQHISPPGFADLINGYIQQTLQSGEMHVFEYQLPVPGRGLRDYEARMVTSGQDEVITVARDITDRKQAEEALKKAEAKYRTLVERLPVIIYTAELGANGVWSYVSPQIEDLLGFTAEEWIADPGLWYRQMDPDDRDRQQVQEEQAYQRNESLISEYRIVARDGHQRWIQDSAQILPPEDNGKPIVQGVLMDLTERKRAEASLNELLAFNEKILNQSPIGILTYRVTGECVFANENAAFIVGASVEQLQSQNFHAIEAWKKSGLYDLVEKAISTQSPVTADVHHISTFGKEVWMTARCVTFKSRHEVHVLLAIADITDRKQAEIERQALLQIMQGLANTKDLVELLKLVHSSIANVVYAENFFVVLYQENSGLFEEIYSVDQYDPPEPPSKLERSITAYVFRSGEPLLLNQQRFNELAALREVELVGTDSASWLGVPLKTSGRSIGVMAVQDYENPNRYTEHDKDFLASIASQVALAIERKRADIELQQKNDDLGLLNAVNEAVVRGENLDSIIELLARGLSHIFSNQGNAIYSTIYMLSSDKQSIVMRKYFFSSEVAHKIEKLIGLPIPIIDIPVKKGGYFDRAMDSKRGTITSDPQDIKDWIAEFVETKFLPPVAKPIVRRLIPQIYKLLNIKSTILVPLISEDEIIGFLDVSGSGLFTANDLERMENIGGQLTAVIQRQQANEKIRRSEEFLQSIQNALSANIAILDETGLIVHVNSAWREFGQQNGLLHPEYCVGLNYLDICDSATGLHAEVASLVAQTIRAVITGQSSEGRIEYPCHSPEANHWFTLHITKFEDGEHIWVVLAHEDITERKQAEIAEREQRALAEALRDTAESLSSTLDYGAVLDQILAAVGRVVPHDAATILLIEGDVAQVVRSQGYDKHGFDNEVMGIKLPLVETTNLREMLQTRQPVMVYDTHSYPGWKRMAATDWLRSSVAAPICIYGEVIGFICLDAQVPEFFTPVHAERLEAFANQAALAMHNARLLQQAQTEITERKQAEKELRASEERFRQLADNIQEVFWMTDAQTGEEIYISPAAELIWGRSVENLMREPDAFVNSVLAEDQPAVSHAVERRKKGENVEIAYRIVRPDGSLRWVWDRAFPIFDDSGRVMRIAGISADITERRESDLALVKSQSRYRELFDSSPISIWEEDFSGVKQYIDRLLESGIIDLNEYLSSHPDKLAELASLVRITDLNEAALDLYQMDRKDVLLKELTQILSEDALSHFQEEIRGLTSPAKRFAWEGRDRMLSGKQMEIMVTGSIPHGYEEDWAKVIVSVTDITERKRAEEELRRRAEETSALLETSLALTHLDLKATLQTISHSAKTLFAADGCRIFLMEPDGETLRCVLTLQENFAPFSDLRIKIGEGVTGAVAASGQAEIVNKMQDDPRAVQVPGTPDKEPEAIMFAPLKERDRTIGVLSIRRVGLGRDFQPMDLELLEAFAAMAASAVSNARLFEETQRRLAELEALYENGLAVGRLLTPEDIGNRVIETFAHYLRWHHVTIRLKHEKSDELELVSFNLPSLKEEERANAAQHFIAQINKVGQGLSGLVIQTGEPLRTGNVHAHSQYINTHAGIQSGLYMPLKVGERVIGVISVESEVPNAFTEQDERLLATLASQAAIAFENARLYATIQKELSERKRAEEALRVSEAHYRELADSITDILFELDHDMRYSHWNKASEALTGVLARDAIGKSMQDIFGDSEEQVRIAKIYEDVLQNRQSRTFETTLFVGGAKRSFEINAYPSRRGVSVVAKDVTDRKRSEIIMQKRFELMEYSADHTLSELMQRTVDEVSEITGSTIGFFHFVEADQMKLGMQTWSTNALRLFNVPIREGAHLPLDQAGVWAEAVRQRRPLIQNDYASLSTKKGLPQGHVPVVREIVIPIIRNERITAVLGIGNKPQDYTQYDLEIAARMADYAWDITERKRMEVALAEERNQLARRVEERTADLSRANSNLARALRVKDEFLANMSHELRTPLNAILGLSESLGEQIAGPLNEKQQKYITTISESGHHLLALINDILDLAKIEAGQITLDINKVDIHSVCQASLRMIKQLAQKKNQEVTLSIEDGLGLMWADERRLKQMIVNLLGNAVKFTPKNGKIGLQVHGDQDANKVTITVWDTGIGIKEADLARLFQPFVQLDSGLDRETTGTGLGLALVAQMARLHGGSVNAFSEPGIGSRFSIVLPWEPALALDSATRMRITGKFRAIKPDDTNKPTILLVEDTKEVIMMIQDYLELAGYKIVTAQDGLDAIVQAKLNHPALILMDVQMPRMDGLEATRKLRTEPDFKYTPIIALTALAMPNDRERCLAAGMDEYISKPINLKALVRIIQSCLFSTEETKAQ